MNIYLLVAMNVTIMCSAVSFSTGISNLKAINLFILQALIFLIIYFNWRIITCNIVMVFAIHQHESAAGIHVFPPSWPPPTSHPVPSLPVVSEHWLWVPCFTHRTCTGHLFYIWQCTCLSAILSNHPTPAFSHLVWNSLLYICLLCSPACRIVGTFFLNSIYMH